MNTEGPTYTGLQSLIGGKLKSPPLGGPTPWTLLGDVPHLSCATITKYDCAADEYLHGQLSEWGEGEGHVESPVAWFAEVTLDPEQEPELTKHYGTIWLIARENSQGFSWVETFTDRASRDERLEAMRAEYAEWDTEVL